MVSSGCSGEVTGDSKVLTEQVASVQQNKVGGLDWRMSVLLPYK